jgi:hypothetical protein
MKTDAFLSRGVAFAAFVLLSFVPSLSAADRLAAKKETPPPALQVQVDVPPAWHPLVEDDVAEALASVLAREFRRNGFERPVAILNSFDEPQANVPLLTLRLQEWRLGRTQNAECTFTAGLRAGGQEHDLGLFTGTRLTWISQSGRWGFGRAHEVADALESAAREAMRDLYRKVAATHAIPDLTLKK